MNAKNRRLELDREIKIANKYTFVGLPENFHKKRKIYLKECFDFEIETNNYLKETGRKNILFSEKTLQEAVEKK